MVKTNNSSYIQQKIEGRGKTEASKIGWTLEYGESEHIRVEGQRQKPVAIAKTRVYLGRISGWSKIMA